MKMVFVESFQNILYAKPGIYYGPKNLRDNCTYKYIRDCDTYDAYLINVPKETKLCMVYKTDSKLINVFTQKEINKIIKETEF